ncbi:MAG: DUF4876 domain-containing protein [Chitinophagaceae bacterium]|nr:MAG: DUF4876 domain-containing protein [Chitinophagaceae bacterium]
MKNQLFIISLLMTIVFVACRKSDIKTVQSINLSVQVSYNTTDSLMGLSRANAAVKITNLLSGQENTTTTNNEGIAIFADIAPGNYTVTAAKNYTAEEFFTTTNITVPSNVAYNASETMVFNSSAHIRLVMQGGKIGNLVIKQYAYAGSNVSTGAAFRDQFVEIYNNSNETIYLDSLYFGNTWQSVTKITSGGVPLDWTTSTGMPTNIGDVNKDYVYAKYLFMIPGTGKQHPLASGKSVIIAATAINHTQDYVMNDGLVQGITDPTKTVDLSKADFETNLVEYNRAHYNGSGTFTPYKWDIDNPTIPNVDVIHIRSGNDWVLDATGREDFFIFKLSKSIKANEWPIYAVPGSPTSFCAQVKVADIIDAVEILTPLESNRVPKRLPIALDATGTFALGGQYSSQSIVRKTIKTIEGRRILQDTNNSANDFETKTKSDASKTESSFEK